jgi:hypothetical protein
VGDVGLSVSTEKAQPIRVCALPNLLSASYKPSCQWNIWHSSNRPAACRTPCFRDRTFSEAMAIAQTRTCWALAVLIRSSSLWLQGRHGGCGYDNVSPARRLHAIIRRTPRVYCARLSVSLLAQALHLPCQMLLALQHVAETRLLEVGEVKKQVEDGDVMAPTADGDAEACRFSASSRTLRCTSWC